MGEPTLGQWRVGHTFNPSGDKRVDAIKSKAADLIDTLEAHKPETTGDHLSDEQVRLMSEAQHLVETAAMHGVKAVTKRVR